MAQFNRITHRKIERLVSRTRGVSFTPGEAGQDEVVTGDDTSALPTPLPTIVGTRRILRTTNDGDLVYECIQLPDLSFDWTLLGGATGES